MFDFGQPPGSRMNYLSNSRREDIVMALKELVSNFENEWKEPQQ